MPLTRPEVLSRTKTMLVREWNLSSRPKKATPLKKTPPQGLGKSELSLRALQSPIEVRDFFDVGSHVAAQSLAQVKTVGELRDVIWLGIPRENQHE